MANRHTLAASRLEEFKDWLISEGFQIHEPKGFYEVIRATKASRKHTLLVHKRASAAGGKTVVHLTVADRDMDIVRAFLRNRRK